MNETLEAMARALFKSWFVDFDPVRARMEGRTPDGMDEVTSALFPNALDERGIPLGWGKVPLLQEAKLISGGTPKTEVTDYWGGNIAWASAKDVSQCPDAFLVGTERTITNRGLEESSTKVIPRFSTVVVARGATTGRSCLFGRDMAMNQTCYGLHSMNNRPFWLNLAFLDLVASLVHAAHGSVFDTITTKTIEQGRVISAGDAPLDAFEDLVRPFYLKILANIEESRTLAALRDLLLPKLLSGELRIKDAEKAVEAAL
jgi:type I restriction enzyme S subunit